MLSLMALPILTSGVSTIAANSWPEDFDKRVSHWTEVRLMSTPPPGDRGVTPDYKRFFLHWHVRIENG
jgi:hypothetical protein